MVWSLGAAAAFTAGGYFGGLVLIAHQNRLQLQEMSSFLLHRAEIEADFAFIGLSDLVEAGVAGCSPSALGAMRRQVYVRGTIKDIRVIDDAGMTACAAFPDTLSFGGLLAWLIVPRKSLLRDIDDALAAEEIVPFVQPVVVLTTGKIVGCERSSPGGSLKTAA